MSQTTHQVPCIGRRRRPLLRALLFGAAVTCIAQQSTAQLKVGSSTGEMVVYEQSEALLIGASVYKNAAAWPKLTSVPTELQSVADVLRQQGFNVTFLPDPSSEQLYEGMKNFLFQRMKAKSRAIVYFSGHGWTDSRGVGYLVGTEAPGSDAPDFKQRLVSMEMIRSLAKDATSRHTLFVFDSCYSGSIFVTRGNELFRAVALEELQVPVVQFLSSGNAKQRSPSDSAFTPAFVAAVKGAADLNGDGIVQANELGLFVSKEVPKASPQTPQFGSLTETGGQVIFLPVRTPVSGNVTATTPPPATSPATTTPAASAAPKVEVAAVVRNMPVIATGTTGGAADFRARFPNTKVYYYRKASDGLAILDVLNKSDIPFMARPAELPDSESTNALACGPGTNIEALKAIGFKLLDAKVKLQAIYPYAQPQAKGGRVQLNANSYARKSPLLTREDLERLTECPKKLTTAKL